MSEVPAFIASAPLTVCVDFRSPQAYLAVAPTRELIERLGVAVDWVPRLIEPPATRPAAPLIEDRNTHDPRSRGARHRRLRAEYARTDLARYGAELGIGPPETHPGGRGVMAALGLLRVRQACPEQCTEFVAAVFDQVWRQKRSADDVAMIARALVDVGAQADGFDSAEQALAEIDSQLRAAGALNVPTYLVAGEPFLGRAHLPMVEWILCGRSGPGPI